ncbi:hypothetical protein [Salinisphaera aquimarina]|uniref:Uncharacterized protein n=1 Tax=Salinisphaera aquimarina TaxID=2094031 RepID=A0ABV7EJ92_9GAMM
MLIFTQSRAGFLQFAAVCLLVLAWPLAAQAADPGKEVTTAADHAGYAAGADTVAKVHLHLHHVVNCLVGPDGDDFDAKSGNPCDGQGNGAINDADSEGQADLKDALALAKTGIGMESLGAAQNVATTVQQLLAKSE